MQKNLVIVESPAKAKTIEKFLGKDYKVLSSYGHIRDLKKKEFSIDTNNFKPCYEVPEEKTKLVKELKKEADNAETVWLASDEDREGEAISWHLYEVLGLNPDHTKRIVFHEITKNAILNAIKTPRNIDINLVNAQQARRVLDRIVGFKISPILWKKVKPALSAGRVQSVAVRLIVEREREIQNFKSESNYRITALFLVPDQNNQKVELKAELNKRFKTMDEAKAFLEKCRTVSFTIDDIATRPLKKSPAAPFTTSTLQQEAARKLGFTVAQTMMVAQYLYEAGNITYMRTDSVNLSSLCIDSSKDVITQLMGEAYLHPHQFSNHIKGAQEAHEAIRPTYMEKQEAGGNTAEKKLYDLIWKRTIASQMADAELEKTTVTLSSSEIQENFIATGEIIKFDGFLRVYRESYDDDVTEQEKEMLLPPLLKGQQLERKDITATERFSQHPLRYTEASLVRKLEELGIGRPSTYAPTISTIQQRGYVEKGDKSGNERIYNIISLKNEKISEKTKTELVNNEKGKLLPTDIGIVVNDFLMQYFPKIMDYNFTANVEKEFDEVAEGQKQWNGMIKDFYKDFEPLVEETSSLKMEHKVGERLLGSDPISGKPVSAKIGRYGPVIQIGSANDEEKPKFAQMKKGESIETITLEDALSLFKLPRSLGEYEGKEITIGEGRFGPYVRHNNKFFSLPKDSNPMKVSFDEAITLIEEKRKAEKEKHIKNFDEEPKLEILNGRYGPYIAYDGKNYKIPKDKEPQGLELTECMAIIKEQCEKPKTSRKGKRFANKKK